MKVLIIDNYDSFTFNLYQHVGEILNSLKSTPDKPHEILVKRNNEISLDDIKELNPDRIIISPGPGSPDDPAYFGICGDVIRDLGKTIPLLGVCLGMQGIAHVFGGKVVQAGVPMHGKTSPIQHDESGVYSGLPQGVEVMRYHSLMVESESLPECLQITSVVADTPNSPKGVNHKTINNGLLNSVQQCSEIMGIKHKQYPIQGVQFHPESFATEGAGRLLSNFIYQVS